MGQRALVAFIVILALVASAADAQQPRGGAGARARPAPLERAPDGQFMLRFERTPIAQVIEEVARITGQRFVFDPAIRGAITIQVPEPVDEQEALQILNTALLMNGYVTVVLEGGVRKVVPVENMPSSAPLIDRPPRADSEDVVTTLVRLETADPEKTAQLMRPLFDKTGLVIPYPQTQSLIMASTERRLHRLLGILRDLESAGEVQIVVLGLRYREAEEVASMIEEALPRRASETEVEKVIPSASSNALIVQSTRERIDRIREFIGEVDVPPVGGGRLHVVPVLHADPERLATALTGLAEGDEAKSGANRLRSSVGLNDYSIVVHAPSRSLIIQADSATFERLSEVITALDREEPRISVELILFEVQLEKSFELGVDLIAPLTGGRAEDDLNAAISSQNTSRSILATAAGIPQPGVVSRFVGNTVVIPITDAAGNVLTTLSLPAVHIVAQERIAEISILQRPHIVVINGEEQVLSVGNNIPVPVAASTDSANPLLIQQTIERYDVGLTIRIAATVGQDGPVRLEVQLEQSSLADSVAGDTTRVGPTIRERTLSATVYLANGETAVIGGLASPRMLSGTSKVPFLGDVPFFGALFRGVRERESEVHLMMAVAANVLKTREEDQLETIRRRTAFERSLSDLGGLREVTNARYALLIGSHATRGRAELDARDFAESSYRAEVVAWNFGGSTRYDVYLTGFDEFGEATLASHEVRAAGWTPRVIVVDRSMPR